MSTPLAGLYLHVPFCARVCPYCDFAVRTGDAALRESYVESLLQEIERSDPSGWSFDTIYFGGGTPSVLQQGQLERILKALQARFDFPDTPWILLEANPEDVDEEAVACWKQLGVRTVSLGVQSFNDEELKFLGRAHDGDDARRAGRLVSEAGFSTYSIDLIYGLPKQTIDDWHRRIDEALEVEPDHLSCYQLTIYAGTRFELLERRGELQPIGDDRQGDFFRATHEHLNRAGFAGYEVSQFARERKFRSPHNQKYWNHTPYLGLGPSAHSFDGSRRWWNKKKLTDWQQALQDNVSPIDATEDLAPADIMLETLMTGFRTYDGVDAAAFTQRFGIDLIGLNASRIERLRGSGLIKRVDRRLIPTLDGLAVADSLATMFRFDAAG